MANSERGHHLSSDKVPKDPEQDLLGYKHFAKHLSESIWKMAPPEGFVIAIYGPWGSGKSTMLSFLEYYIKQMPESEQPIIVHFNPWWFSGHEDLTIRFFGQMQAVLSKGEWIKEYKVLKNKLADLAELVAKTPIPDPTIQAAAYIGGNIVSRILLNQENIIDLKSSISKELEEKQRKILVIIDDIDRLTAEEIKQLFRVIKAVADFPNIIYLLAFDKDIVIKSLDGIQGKTGEAYLEKIVQLPFELPLPSKITLCKILHYNLEEILAGTPEDLLDDRYRSNMYLRYICDFIDTPRDIIRLTNTLKVTYPSVKGEVNSVDFISIETLRVFCPLAYDIIRRNPQEFTGVGVDILDASHVKDDEAFHNSWINEMQKDIDKTKLLIRNIFPRLDTVWGGGFYGGFDRGSTWRKERRICIQGFFPTYFHLTLPEGIISHTEMKAILALSEDSRAFTSKLQELADQKRSDGTSKVSEFLWRFADYTTEDDIPQDKIPQILNALFNVGDVLLTSEMGDISRINSQLDRIIRQLLLRLDESRRFDILKGSISNGCAISTIFYEIYIIGRQHGKYDAEKNVIDSSAIISLEHLNVLENIALEKIRKAAKNKSLLKAPTLLLLLYIWQNLSDENEVNCWVKDVISSDEGLVMFLESALFIWYSRDIMGAILGRSYQDPTGVHKPRIYHYRLDPKSLEPYLDLSQIIDRVKGILLSEGLTEYQKIALKQFIDEYEMRKNGRDPDNPMDRATWKSE